MATNHSRTLYKDYVSEILAKESLQKQVQILNTRCDRLKRYADSLENENVKLVDENTQKDVTIQSLSQKNAELEREVAHLKALLGTDGTNSGLPTSQTPINKKKVIPNSRVKTGKTKGGQPGHEKAKLKRYADDEITQNVVHKEEVCPVCGGKLVETGVDITKDETDFYIGIDKTRHHFVECRCQDCGRISRARIPNRLKEENQYGPRVQAVALGLMNVANVPVNKVKKMVRGLTMNQIELSEGYIMKLQKQAAKNLRGFYEDMRKHCLKMQRLHWDDTVVSVDTKRACLRFYGDEKAAYYTAHEHKNKEGLTEDGILPLLPKETVVMHDHNIVNYCSEYSFTNIECNAHLLRDLQKVYDITQHPWAKTAKELISEQIHRRNQLKAEGITEFSEEEINNFFAALFDIIHKGSEEAQNTPAKYGGNEERALLVRLAEYRAAYFAWVTNFELPTTNNVSERSLRGCKTKMKVSGQFQATDSARNYAVIKTYLETCARNGVNEVDALTRLCVGTPCTVEGIFGGGCE